MDDIMISCPTLERTMKAEEYFCPEILLARSFFAHNIMAQHSLTHPFPTCALGRE